MDTLISKLMFVKLQDKQRSTQGEELILMTWVVRIEADWKMHVLGPLRHRKPPSLC